MYPSSSILSCPLVRSADLQDVPALVETIINSGSPFIKSIFSEAEDGGKSILERHYQQSIDGVHLLMEGEEIIGVMKLHLPSSTIGGSLSYRELIEELGWLAGIRAGILLSFKDEYKLKADEAYLEYIYISKPWQAYNATEVLLDKVHSLCAQNGVKYLTYFIPSSETEELERLDEMGFVNRKKVSSLLARILGSPHKSWYKCTRSINDQPITVRELVADKIDSMKSVLQSRRRETFAAIRLTTALTIIPIAAGILAFSGGFYLAVLFWIIIGSFHLIGARLYLRGSNIGRYGLATALIIEGINLVGRSLITTSWFDRSWHIMAALLTFWIASVMLRYSPKSFEPTAMYN